MNQNLIEKITQKVIDKCFIRVEASGRHVHLSQEHLELLFGKGYELTPIKELSQPGQYACKERVTIKGKKGEISNVVILGPVRKETQVEVSNTDALKLGEKAPVRQSGKINGSAPITIKTDRAEITLSQGLIVAKNHIHMSPEDAKLHGLKDQDSVNVKILSDRPIIFEDVLIRVNENFKTFMHIDYDESNACNFKNGVLGIIKE